mgnify:CR=1 FL=1
MNMTGIVSVYGQTESSPGSTMSAWTDSLDLRTNTVGYDFPQDYEIRLIRTMKPGDIIVQPVHDRVLKEGKILQIEYMTNLWQIGHDTCQLIALPLNTQNADGSQIRVIAVVEEGE